MSSTLRIDQDSIDKYWSSREDARGFVDYLIDREHWTLDHNVNIAAKLNYGLHSYFTKTKHIYLVKMGFDNPWSYWPLLHLRRYSQFCMV